LAFLMHRFFALHTHGMRWQIMTLLDKGLLTIL